MRSYCVIASSFWVWFMTSVSERAWISASEGAGSCELAAVAERCCAFELLDATRALTLPADRSATAGETASIEMASHLSIRGTFLIGLPRLGVWLQIYC